ncbi:MAG TPA: TonB family protein [Thermodesulfovibrionales bacterium]|nr:TonB family protein [Thermodesulfovibrionales bacterium]
MTGPSLQRFTLVSLVFHLIFFLTVFLAVRQSARRILSAPYVVSLVGSEIRAEGNSTQPLNKALEPQVPDIPSKKESPAVLHRKDQKKLTRNEEQQVQERIDALKAKKTVERIAKLRNIVSLKGTGSGMNAGGKAGASQGTAGKGAGSAESDYYSKITKEIWQQWIFPETGDRNLEAIISIRIMRDGAVQVSRVEKSSGNSLFDKSALRAISKASPVTPPPYEMEIGVRFYP